MKNGKKTSFNRLFSLILALALILAMIPASAFPTKAVSAGETLYFIPGDQWGSDGAWFAAYFFGAGETWAAMSDTDGDGRYECQVPSGGYTNVIFCRMKSSSTDLSWDNKWNQTADLTLSKSHNCFTMTSSTQWSDAPNGTWSTYTPPVPETTAPTQAPSQDVTIHFRNTSLWSAVKFYAWNADTQDPLLGAWPGTTATAEAGTINWYSMTLEDVGCDNVGFVFNDGAGNQTGDVLISNIPANGGEYWYDGTLTTTAPSSYPDGSIKTVSCKVTLHFVNSKNWSAINAYAWAGNGNPLGFWPGKSMGLDADGFYTISTTVEVPEGQSVGYIINNGGSGSQTVDLSISAAQIATGNVELWLQPTTEYVDDDASSVKYNCNTYTDPGYIAISPEVDGTSVTLRYAGSYGDTVKVYGSMNYWKSAYTMTANGYGVYSCTIDNLNPGTYEYKLMVNGNWITDPANGWTTADGNSAFQILDPNAVDNNTVTIKLHYARPDGNYTNWNLWVWGDTVTAGQYDFTTESGEKVATVEVDGRATQYISYIPRYSVGTNSWVSQEYGERRVYLGDVVSGTIHCYISSGAYDTTMLYGTDVVKENKISSVEYNYDTEEITITTTSMVSVDPMDAFEIVDVTGADTSIAIKSIEEIGSNYVVKLNKSVSLAKLYRYKIRFLDQRAYTDYTYSIRTTSVYASERFGNEFTYTGTDLGAVWTSSKTTFRVWAPTAESVSVRLYTSGTDGTNDLIKSVAMTKSTNGTWVASVSGNQNGVYYTYAVSRNGETVEACDPYARTTGVNGVRAMIINLDSTDPDGWDTDTNPNTSVNYTDAIIYELHVRDFSIDDSSGITNKGKYLGLTEYGTTTANGTTTGLDYLKELGITHLHLLPVYDFASTSVDETKLDTPQFNWGYDPQNYNVPEGSYSTDPYKGEVRVKEFKQMVKTLHDNGISVIMDVVYNHVSDAGKFSMNKIVPGYFSRQNADGSFSNGSGCGNDTASEREMVRKYIVESVMYWAEEYHINGFRFDLVGLLDATTINQIVDTVHAKYPEVIFYGEGWTMGTAVEPGNTMATQATSGATPNFAYFSDTIRNALAGSNGSSTGFVSGGGHEGTVADSFLAQPGWTNRPTQIIQYASCHDNYTLADKLVLSTGRSGIDSTIIKMNKLTAAIYMTAQGVPFIHAGEEFLREKLEEDGGRCENSYNASDYVNHIEWSNLDNSSYKATSEYYKGLIEFRKNHAALRLNNHDTIMNNVTCTTASNGLVVFNINGGVNGEISDGIVVIFNANSSSKTVYLPSGSWKVCVNDKYAGTDVLGTAYGSVTVPGISAMVLVKGATSITHSYGGWSYNETSHWQECTCCETGKVRINEAAHSISGTTCSVCGYTQMPDEGEEDVTSDITVTAKSFSLSFEDEILVNMYYTISDLTNVAEHGMLVFHSSPSSVSYSKADAVYNTPVYDTASARYKATTDGVPAKEMGDVRYYVAYAKLTDGSYAYSKVYDYSPKKYAMNMLGKTSTSAKQKSLCVAMLNYGAAAQNYFGYKTDDLMNSELTAAQKALAVTYSADLFTGTVAADSNKIGSLTATSTGFSKKSATVSFEGAFSINYYFTPNQTVSGNITFYYWSPEDYAAATTLTTSNATGSVTMVQGTDGRYWAQVSGIAAKQIDQTFYVCAVYKSGWFSTYRTGIVPYSLSKYCMNNATSSDAGMAELAKATAVYGYHAETYFAN